jgi:hypothetical protein
MPRPFPDAYTFNHARAEDGAVTFSCSTNSDIWPWLTLPPTHPIFIQTINFWASFDSAVFLDEFRADAWTALTGLKWTCGPAEAGRPASGRYLSEKDQDRARYALTLWDAAGTIVADYTGEGVTFRTRNFEGWRGKAKAKLEKADRAAFDYAPAASVGVATQKESFLSPLQQISGTEVSTGLITKENGLRPAHPYIGGSGDHVNSTHMGEIARQFGALLLERPTRNLGGEMVLKHYVELGVPFDVKLLARYDEGQSYSLLVRQAGRDCAQIDWTYA